MAIHTTEIHDLEAQVEEAASLTEALAREHFGSAAYLRRAVHEGRETGEERPISEVHCCFADWETNFDRLTTLHDRFMHACVRVLPREVLAHAILSSVPSDAD